MNVYQKLAKCRVELQETKLRKSGKNKYAGFEYFELSDFLPTVNIIFEKNGLCSIFNIFGEKAVLNIFNSEKPDEVIVFQSKIADLELKGCNEIQALGGTITYMRRYLYMNALEIVESDTFDSMVVEKEVKKETKHEKQEYITLAQKKQLKEKIGGNEFAKLMNKTGGKLTVEEFERVING